MGMGVAVDEGMKLSAPFLPWRATPERGGGSRTSRKQFIVRTEWGGGAQGSPESHHFKAFWKGVPSFWSQECQPPLGLSTVCLPSGDSRARV